ncbi:MAG: 2,4-dihydroxyhept-2-ene-1,7-dioic acid aldolase [Lentisphaerae bacterium]|nr:2,4-dihydroxyhept-2-ene-1,7-dioic acid aldolase [Lentisphaerota bacterium]
MDKNAVVNALRQRQPCLGSWVQVGHAAVAEMLARAGFAWLGIDAEHGEVVEQDYGNLFRAMRGYGTVPLVRVRENAVLPIRRALDLGAGGIIVPLVETADQAACAVAAARYPPEGVRGFAFQRANAWGVDFDAYVAAANHETAVVVMIESKAAVENIDAILAVAGVDGVFVGPYDLSGSYGIPGRTDAPVIADACRRVADACSRAGKSAGQHLVKPTADTVRTALEQGFTFLALGMDTVFLTEGAAAVRELAGSFLPAGPK